MNKVILITWYRSINYGTCLQAYALYNKIAKMGYDIKIAEKTDYHTFITITDFFRRLNKKIKNIITPKKNDDILPNPIVNQYIIRKNKMDNFANTHMDIYKIAKKSDYYKMNQENDIFITGSDQIWNPYYLSLAALLCFVSNNKTKISYSTSIGVSTIPNDLKKIYRKYLSRFGHLSVREKSAADLLSKLLNRKISVTADPTFLLEYNELIELSMEDSTLARAEVGNKPFILCYFIGENDEWVNAVKRLSDYFGYNVIHVLTESHIIPDFGLSNASFGISDFIWLINNAEYICTDSFHCSALSINLSKEFFVFKRFKDTDNNSQNSRIYDLLKTFQLDDRLIVNDDIINKSKSKIDYQMIDTKLNTIRKESNLYLSNAFNKT